MMEDNHSGISRAAGTSRVIGAAKRPRTVLLGAGALLVLAAIYLWGEPGQAQAPPAAASAAKGGVGGGPVRVESALAARADVPIYAQGLGTVQAFYTVTVSPRVDGELLSLGFTEGQTVKKGDLLAKIDPRPYRAALDQASATKAKDAAMLANARRDLARYQTLAPEQLASKQTLDTQAATVAQLEAQVAGDQAAIDSARTNLDYTTIRSPIQGRTGIRMVDPGNIVHSAAATGIVVVTQVQPIAVIFTLPAESLQSIRQALAAGSVPVSALSRDARTPLGEGVVNLIDNQVDQATGTIRLKATFPNAENKLWPGDFVNARVLVEIRKNALTVPSAAIQRGPNGVFAYVVKADNTVEARLLKIGADTGSVSIVEGGLQEGERVTTSNQYRLQPGAHVQVVAPQQAPADAGKGAPAAAGK
ncbi:MAG TPA: efflux RND transporter periplasmic adaptor subunit [Burkholderiales bacterium]|nr:efflux RND transporter periplasmic adaptor subunit [Burkholderiales bacterium]